MRDVLRDLVENSYGLVASGYYDPRGPPEPAGPVPSLVQALRRHPTFPIIAEVKLSSPDRPSLSRHGPEELVRHYREGGAAALSVLTEPNHFHGSLASLPLATATGLPSLMKDVIVSERQIEAGARLGSSAILLIERTSAHPSPRVDMDELIEKAHQMGLEVLLEVSDRGEALRALDRGADLIGINQRDLATLRMDRSRGAALLKEFRGSTDLPIVVMSGIDGPGQVRAVRDLGADGALVGTMLSSSPDPAGSLRGLAVER